MALVDVTRRADVGWTQERSEQSANRWRGINPWRTAFGEYTLLSSTAYDPCLEANQ